MIDIIGYLAGILTLLNMIPQLFKTYKHKRAQDVSYLMVVTYVLSMLMWVIYAIYINSWPIIITNSVAGILGIIQLSLMINYRKN